MIRFLNRKHGTRSQKPTKVKEPPTCHHVERQLMPAVISSDTQSPDKAEHIPPTPKDTQISSDDKPPNCPSCIAEKRAARKYRWKLLFCLLPCFFLASLDLTIVATALPFIASHFDKLNQLNWIVTAFTLTSAAFIPAFGQLADIFGRHATLQFAVAFMTIGSTLSAAAVNWPMMLIGRALQGVSAAGIQNVAMIVLADSVSLKEQAINTSIFQLMTGVGYSVGPLIGGYITNANWRYCFVLSIGISVISIPTILLLRKDLKQGRISLSSTSAEHSRFHRLCEGLAVLDLGGMTLFVLGAGLIILGTAWGGSTFAWNSAAVLSSLIIGIVFFLLFVIYEYLLEPGKKLSILLPKVNPMLPFNLLQKKDVRLIALIAAATGSAIYSVFYFIGIYFVLVEGYRASRAGVQLLYYVPGIGAGVWSAIYLCNVWPRQTIWPLMGGTIVETTGLALLTYAVKARNSTLVNVMMVVAGAGTGVRFMPMNLHLAGLFRPQLAAAYSILRFSLPFGGTLALTIMGAVFQNKMAFVFGSSNVSSSNNNTTGSSNSTSSSFNLHNQAALQAIANLPPAEQAIIRAAGANATMWAFISLLPLLGLSVVASKCLGNVWIAPKEQARLESNEESKSESQSTQPITSEYIDSIYLTALVTGKVNSKKKKSHNISPPAMTAVTGLSPSASKVVQDK